MRERESDRDHGGVVSTTSIRTSSSGAGVGPASLAAGAPSDVSVWRNAGTALPGRTTSTLKPFVVRQSLGPGAAGRVRRGDDLLCDRSLLRLRSGERDRFHPDDGRRESRRRLFLDRALELVPQRFLPRLLHLLIGLVDLENVDEPKGHVHDHEHGEGRGQLPAAIAGTGSGRRLPGVSLQAPVNLARVMELLLQFRVGDKRALEPLTLRGRQLSLQIIEELFGRQSEAKLGGARDSSRDSAGAPSAVESLRISLTIPALCPIPLRLLTTAIRRSSCLRWTLIGLAVLLLGLVVFHGPILRAVVHAVAVKVASRQNVKLDLRVEGGVLGGITLRNVHATATGPSAVQSLDADLIHAEYSLPVWLSTACRTS